jgi:hypothetical protein
MGMATWGAWYFLVTKTDLNAENMTAAIMFSAGTRK